MHVLGSQGNELPGALYGKVLESAPSGADTSIRFTSIARDRGLFKLVLTLAEAPDWSGASKFSATRFEASVRPGDATHYNSTEGVVIDFACKANADAMSIRVVEQVAAAPTR